MERRYDILFSISVNFVGKRVPGLSIRPTMDCQRQLARHNLLFKANDTGAWIIVEKIRGTDGALRPTKPLNTTVGFSFIIENRNANLLASTEPVGRNTYQSQIAGRNSVIFYFDNLDAGFAISSNPELAADGIGSSDEDVFFLYPNTFSLPVNRASKLRAQPLVPNAPVVEILPDTPSAQIFQTVLSQGAYFLEGFPNGAPPVMERSLVHSKFDLENAIGVVSIFKDETVDYNQARGYTISFQKCI